MTYRMALAALLMTASVMAMANVESFWAAHGCAVPSLMDPATWAAMALQAAAMVAVMARRTHA